MSNLSLFESYLEKWGAQPDGEPFKTHAGHLLPIDLGGRPAMIKIARHIDERVGGRVMQWWDGQGAARIYAYDEVEGALLMERAIGSGDLLRMARGEADDQASRIVCGTLELLHAERVSAVPHGLLSLASFFASLAPMAQREGGLMADCARTADELLTSQRDVVVLHGDAHHGNVLDFGDRGWLAIDPKRVTGERCYDYVNVLCNPDLETCAEPARFARQVEVIVAAARLDRSRLLKWVMAHAALSAAWFLEDGDRNMANSELAVARLAQHALEQNRRSCCPQDCRRHLPCIELHSSRAAAAISLHLMAQLPRFSLGKGISTPQPSAPKRKPKVLKSDRAVLPHLRESSSLQRLCDNCSSTSSSDTSPMKPTLCVGSRRSIAWAKMTAGSASSWSYRRCKFG